MDIVCSHCKKVLKTEVWEVRYRYWRRSVRWGSNISHGICPECYNELITSKKEEKHDS